MRRSVTCIGFDADDTLWHNERFFQLTQARFADLLRDYTDQDRLMARLLEAEKRNLGHYGFGIKGFVLSMIETAIEVTEGRVPASVIAELLQAGREMLRHPVELLPHAHAAVTTLKATHRVVLVTKGDLLDQERKLAQSGLDDLFDAVEIVSDKTPQVYERIFAQHGDGPARGLMVGNSMRSDVRPMIDVGGWGVFIPHGATWDIEHAPPPQDRSRYAEIDSLADLPGLVRALG
ncbi:HAD family hydrolase [Sulfitobacter sabulilitoris]|uniref:HAD family hydrolase n=1 Tax=Sulfitobacter sabulilitoris TaxID=2562655 RepID=A0A5S3PL15_9RHOB|nr:HAD family hydrolase [Sulfitobacter sabulilitoris]TMM52906.1 HAD family hydrolase [Sulfitobacter sabulilitoris]